MSTTAKKFVIVATHGPEDPERASLPFFVGNGALAMESPCTVILQASATLLAKEGSADHVLAPEMPPLKTLMELFVEYGGKILVCQPCLNARHILPETLVKGVEIIVTARLVLETLEAGVVLSY